MPNDEEAKTRERMRGLIRENSALRTVIRSLADALQAMMNLHDPFDPDLELKRKLEENS